MLEMTSHEPRLLRIAGQVVRRKRQYGWSWRCADTSRVVGSDLRFMHGTVKRRGGWSVNRGPARNALDPAAEDSTKVAQQRLYFGQNDLEAFIDPIRHQYHCRKRSRTRLGLICPDFPTPSWLVNRVVRGNGFWWRARIIACEDIAHPSPSDLDDGGVPF